MAHSLRQRLARLEARAPDPAVRRRAAEAAADIARQERAFLAVVPADLRAEVAAALSEPRRSERLSGWRLHPVARGATLPVELPRELVRVMLDDPEGLVLHECERCSLGVPIRPGIEHAPGRGKVPAVRLFPACPACGGRTGYSAYEHTRGRTPPD